MLMVAQFQPTPWHNVDQNSPILEDNHWIGDMESRELAKNLSIYLKYIRPFPAANVAPIGREGHATDLADEINEISFSTLWPMHNPPSSAIVRHGWRQSGRQSAWAHLHIYLGLCCFAAFSAGFFRQRLKKYDQHAAISIETWRKRGGQDRRGPNPVIVRTPTLLHLSLLFALAWLAGPTWYGIVPVSFTTLAILVYLVSFLPLTISVFPSVPLEWIQLHLPINRLKATALNPKTCSVVTPHESEEIHRRYCHRTSLELEQVPGIEPFCFSSSIHHTGEWKSRQSPSDTPLAFALPPSPRGAPTSSPLDAPFPVSVESIQLSTDGAHLVELDSSIPVSLSGSCDLFTGVHMPTMTRLAMKSPRFTSATMVDILRQFKREAKTWSHFNHFNILPFLGLIEKGHRFYLISPLLPRGDLLKFVQNRPKMPSELSEAATPMGELDPYSSFNELRTVRDIAAGLAYLHNLDVVHGNLKARNILLTDDNRAQICDFGLTQVLDRAVCPVNLGGANSIRWQSPELILNQPKTYASDVYAFGMTITEILTGSVPFPYLKSQSAVVKAVALRDERPSFNPSAHLGVDYLPLWRIAAKAWATRSIDRPTIKQVLEELEQTPG